MNKHTKKAIVTAMLGLMASAFLWSVHVKSIPLPDVPNTVVQLVEEIMGKLAKEEPEEPIHITEVRVEKLGEHFSTETTTATVTASVVSQSSSSVAVDKRPIAKEVAEEVVEPTKPAAPVAPTELQEWELKRAWGITVPSLGIRAPVMLPSLKYWSTQAWDLMEEQMQVGLNHGTVAYPHSAGPGRMGSLIIAGHSSPPTPEAKQSVYGSVFEKLPEIEIGQDITVSTSASPITYRVEEKMIVSPKVTSILAQQYDESVLKLITCYPVGTTTNRMIIIAKKIEE